MKKKFAIGATVKTNSQTRLDAYKNRTGVVKEYTDFGDARVTFTDGKCPYEGVLSPAKLDAYKPRLPIGTRVKTTVREYGVNPGRIGTIRKDNGTSYEVEFDDDPCRFRLFMGGFLTEIHGAVKPDFKIGDKVRVRPEYPASLWANRPGLVESLSNDKVHIKFTDGGGYDRGGFDSKDVIMDTKPRRKKGDAVRVLSGFPESGRKGVIDLVFDDGTCTVEFPHNPCCPGATQRGIYKDTEVQPAELKEGSRVIMNFPYDKMGLKGVVQVIRPSGENYSVKMDDGSVRSNIHGAWLWMDDDAIQIGDTVTIAHTFTVKDISQYGDVGTPFGHFSQSFLQNHGAVILERTAPPYIPAVDEVFTIDGGSNRYVTLYVDDLIVLYQMADIVSGGRRRYQAVIEDTKFNPITC